ncbi:MAG TPA: IS607 family transposase [Candidatus Dormibacteraeota bacterium]|nr:IS607 family transposase [Candidatus Dormibacteraeota bacterium]
MKLADWARRQGISYTTAWRWVKNDAMPVPWKQLAGGTILVDAPIDEKPSAIALYARVSSHDQRNDLDRQLARLATYAASHDLHVVEAVAEVGSGLNGKRRKLLRLLSDARISAIVVEHRDRFARFGSEYLEAALAASGRRLIVVDSGERNDDLVQDMIAILTSFCARLYGRRSARNRAISIERALARVAPE